MEARDLDVFNEIVGDEIDSDFASSIACCDACYVQFRELWPGVAFRDIEFQSQGMEVQWLVDNLRLVGLYSPAELSTLRHFVSCPRCGRFIQLHVWIYEHRFSGVAELEAGIGELLDLGSRTPFLLLEHPLARKVVESVRAQSGRLGSAVLAGPVYRARTRSSVKRLRQAPEELSTFATPPASATSEGRFNHAGAPMLYVADDAATACAEVAVADEPCLVASLRLVRPLKILDLVDVDEEEPSFELFAAISNSALMAAPRTGEGWMRRQYVFSRFVADCARSSGFDAIRYGSTKTTGGANYVLLDPEADDNPLLVLESVSEMVAGGPAIRY